MGLMKNKKKQATPCVSVTVTDEQDRFRADRALSALVPAIGRRASKAFFRRGNIRLNGITAEGSERVHPGDALEYPDPQAPENRELFHTTIAPRLTTPHGLHLNRLYEDDILLVIAKPSEIPVHKGQGGFTRRDTIEDVLKRAYSPEYNPQYKKERRLKKDAQKAEPAASESSGKRPDPGFYLVHRLDQETSGCLMVAKNEATLTALVQEFAARRVKKEYWALVVGEVPWKEKTIRRPIKYERSREPEKLKKGGKAPEWVKRKRSPKIMKGVKRGIALEENAEEGKACETYFRVKERFKGYTLLHCEPRTGRTHQIRVHLFAEGYPLAYDPLYGRSSPLKMGEFNPAASERPAGEEILLTRQPLHAAKISFKHPSSGETMQVSTGLPRDLREFLRVLRKYRKK